VNGIRKLPDLGLRCLFVDHRLRPKPNSNSWNARPLVIICFHWRFVAALPKLDFLDEAIAS
jgi:hypothetical protein